MSKTQMSRSAGMKSKNPFGTHLRQKLIDLPGLKAYIFSIFNKFYAYNF